MRQLNFSGDLTNSARDVTTLFSPCGWQNCPASQGDEPRRGGGGLTPTGAYPPSVRLAAAIMAVLSPLRNDTWAGNPSGSSSHLPCKAEEFCLRTDKLIAAMDFKSVVAYQRGSMKLFFSTEFRLRTPLTEEYHNRTSGAKTLAPPAVSHSRFKASLPRRGLVVACWARDAVCEVVGAPACWGVLWPC